ncbi:hypothetical protein BOTBODRAFT_123870 [Botryobasidium botryosum FD-172 SS1]|uniref:Non-structural maintenance of chromosomes element 4 n=1 Tax=Botryobasidium botryosum (strain FD-172 SS1) TaxID=930990 RepID=A0A067NDS7_BOTB1|nr:hypothetical protein BOTBODRAFT_123870 [Botryobasidium botryosum FD-172 SS1]
MAPSRSQRQSHSQPQPQSSPAVNGGSTQHEELTRLVGTQAPGSTQLAYDPDQDRNEKRQLRRDYREIIEEQKANKQNIDGLSIDQMAKTLARSDLLFDKVRAPQEATLDSQFLLLSSDIGALKARAMKADVGGFDVDDFITKLALFMGGRRAKGDDLDDDGGADILDWAKIGRKALGRSRKVPGLNFMLGPLAIEQKKRVTAKRAKLEKNKEDEVRPQELNEKDIQRSENETSKNVENISKILDKWCEKHQKANLFELIVNPHDYGQTVENLFYLSFLIRDAKVTLEIEENKLPVVWTCEAPNEEDYQDSVKKLQIIMELDMETWRRAIQVFNITEPMIPTRPPPKDLPKGKGWYS